MALAGFPQGIQTPSIIGNAPRPSPVTIDDAVVLSPTMPSAAVRNIVSWTPDYTYTGPTGVQIACFLAPTIRLPLTSSIFTLQGVRFQANITTTVNSAQLQSSLFSNANTINYGGTVVASNIVRSFVDVVKINALAGVAAGTLTNYRSAHFTPTISADAGGSLTVGNLNLVDVGPTLNGAGFPAITTYRGLNVNDVVIVLGGTIGTSVAVDIANLVNATTNISLRSAGAAVEMRHAGPAVFGANAAPTNASVGLEVNSTTKVVLLPRMNTTQIGALTAVEGMLVFDNALHVGRIFQSGSWQNFS